MNAPDRVIHRDREAEQQNGPEQVPTTAARQGLAQGRVRYVLTISVLLVVVAFAIIYFTAV